MALLPADFDINLFAPQLIILSSEVHIEKPALKIFQLAVEKAAVKPAACLFCNENLLDTLAAQKIGMQTARLQPPPNGDIGSLTQKIEELSALIT